MMNDELVQCDQHGIQGFGLVCQHLSKQTNNLGFHQQEVGEIKPDAWCDPCHERWQTQNNTEHAREVWENECGFKIICATCYEEIERKNKTEFPYDLNIFSLAEIIQKLDQKKEDIVNKNLLPHFLPELYIQLITTQETEPIAIECKLLSLEEAFTINQNSFNSNEWIFATTIGPEYWTFTEDQFIHYYEQEGANLVAKKLKISFDEWLQLAFLLKKLDFIQQKYLVTVSLQNTLQNSLKCINPILNSYFEDII